MFKAIYLSRDVDEQVTATLTELNETELPNFGVSVDVEYSTINYKDGLAIMGRPGVVRTYPMVPGIDLAGTVTESTDCRYSTGDQIILNGWEVGENHWGGLSQKAKLNPDWLVRLPEALNTEQAMAIGTAGYTAMLCVLSLERHNITPKDGPIMVTGASGGVGSIAVAILSNLGYEVLASTGRSTGSDYLTELGATEIIDRSELACAGKPLQKSRWAGAIDVTGSHTLANVIAQTKPGGCVASCGLAQGADLQTTVMPFILRGVTLDGINSVYEPYDLRTLAWSRLVSDLDAEKLQSMTKIVGLGESIGVAAAILDGEVRGRVVVDVNR